MSLATVHPLIPLVGTVWLSPALLELVDVRDVEVVDDQLERIEIGIGCHDLIVEADDLVRAVEDIKALLDQVVEHVIEARQDALEAALIECWCGTKIPREALTCGSPRCDRFERQDAAGLVR